MKRKGRVVKGSGWGKSGNEIRNVESRSLERAVRGKERRKRPEAESENAGTTTRRGARGNE